MGRMSDQPRPVVALALSEEVARCMFRPVDLERLRTVAQVRGPVDARDRQALRQALAEATVAISGWGSPRFDEDLLAMAPKLRLLAHSAGTVKPFVSDALFARGIRVSTAASVNAIPVAQFTVAMMVLALKQVPWIAAAFARGDYEEVARRKDVCRELQDLSVGIIGASRVGRAVIGLLKAHPRLRICLYDPYVRADDAARLGVERVSLEEACACDIVSLHAPNIPETRHMIDAQRLALMPDHALFINTSRGALVDEQALVAEVKRRPLYVVLDVTDPEPPAADSPLRTAPNILLTPHIAGAMKQARLDMGELAVSETIRFLRGEPLEHEVTQAMLPTQA